MILDNKDLIITVGNKDISIFLYKEGEKIGQRFEYNGKEYGGYIIAEDKLSNYSQVLYNSIETYLALKNGKDANGEHIIPYDELKPLLSEFTSSLSKQYNQYDYQRI